MKRKARIQNELKTSPTTINSTWVQVSKFKLESLFTFNLFEVDYDATLPLTVHYLNAQDHEGNAIAK